MAGAVAMVLSVAAILLAAIVLLDAADRKAGR